MLLSSGGPSERNPFGKFLQHVCLTLVLKGKLVLLGELLNGKQLLGLKLSLK